MSAITVNADGLMLFYIFVVAFAIVVAVLTHIGR